MFVKFLLCRLCYLVSIYTIKNEYIAPHLSHMNMKWNNSVPMAHHYLIGHVTLYHDVNKNKDKQPNWSSRFPTCCRKKYWRWKETATERWVTKQNKNKGHLSCTQYKHRRHFSDRPLSRPWGFPWLPSGLTYWLCGLQRDRSGQTRVLVIQQFLKRPWSSFTVRITNSSVWRQSRRGGECGRGLGVWGILGNRRGEEEGPTVFAWLLYQVWEMKTSVIWRLYCTLRNSRDRQVTGRLLAVEGCYMSGEAVSAVQPSIKNTERSGIVCLEPTHRCYRRERGLLYESRESAAEQTRHKHSRFEITKGRQERKNTNVIFPAFLFCSLHFDPAKQRVTSVQQNKLNSNKAAVLYGLFKSACPKQIC